MPKYIIKWNSGFGDEAEVIIVNNLKEAEEVAYDEFVNDLEGYHAAEEYTEELAEELGLN